jgi:hypothetical protein
MPVTRTSLPGIAVVATSKRWRASRFACAPRSYALRSTAGRHVEAQIVGNRVYDNNNAQSAAIEIAVTAVSNGILVAGGRENVVERNLVTGHQITGIGVIPLPETVLYGDEPEARDFDGLENTVRDNVTSDNQYDLASITSLDDPSDAGGNCFARNEYATSTPADIEAVLPCDGSASGYEADIALFAALLGSEKPPAVDYKVAVLPDPPADLPNLPKAKTAKARPATKEPSISVKAKQLQVPTA